MPKLLSEAARRGWTAGGLDFSKTTDNAMRAKSQTLIAIAVVDLFAASIFGFFVTTMTDLGSVSESVEFHNDQQLSL
jgi:hypothetical protein